jgi:hypothetical protein
MVKMSDNDTVTFTNEQQELVNRLVGEARVKAREKAVEDYKIEAEKLAKDAEHEKLIEEEKFKELAETFEAKVRELEPFKAQAERFDSVIEVMLEKRFKELGEAAKKAVEMLDNPLAKLEWLEANASLFTAKNDSIGTPIAPKGAKDENKNKITKTFYL